MSSSRTLYWGTSLLTRFGTPSPTFARYLSVLFTHMDASSPPYNIRGLDPAKVANAEEARGVSPDENVIIELLQIILDASGTIPDSDAAIAAMYRVRGIDHVMATRQGLPGEEVVWDGMPIVTNAGFMAMQVRELALNPRVYWEGMNKVLEELRLVDPVTGTTFTPVPWECCPQEPVPEVVKWVEENEKAVMREMRVWFEGFAERRKRREEVDAANIL